MTVSVLIVDDSSFFRRRLGEMIDSVQGLKVVGSASNGQEAIDLTIKLKPDVITMDYEMPVMDGITAVRQIMEQCPTPILMFSSLTYEGARVTLDSLDAGAVDFLPKNFSEISSDSAKLKKRLTEYILDVANSGPKSTDTLAIKPSDQASDRLSRPLPVPKRALHKAQVTSDVDSSSMRHKEATRSVGRAAVSFELIAIGTSTGGPVALPRVLADLPADFPVPIVLVQHMPAAFTSAFAERLNVLCNITVKEAVDGDRLNPGVALLAPGGKQLMISNGGRVKVLPGDKRLNYKPCVDVTFASAANVFADKVLAVVLTGMGSDGCEGAKMLKKCGATVWGQDKESSVIYGMPMAVAKANLTDEVLSLDQIGPRLKQVI